MHRSTLRLGAVIAVAGLVLMAGCGSDDDDSSDVSEVATEASSAVSSAVTEASTAASSAATEASTAASSAATEASTAGSEAATDSTAGSSEEGPELDPTKPVRLATAAQAQQWDPHKSTSQAADTPSFVLVYDRLLRLNGDGGVDPWLATSYEFSDDGLTLTMQLRDDVTFHDGEAFNADVAVANLMRAKAEPSTLAAQLANVTEVVADSPTELRLVLAKPDPTIALVLGTTTGSMISPAALDSPTLQQEPVGSGPFLLESTGPEGNVFVPAPEYWNEDLFRPDRVETLVVTDDTARLNLLKDGGIEMMNVAPATFQQGVELGETDEFNTYITPALQENFLFLNTARPPLDNPEVRRALNLAIDREAIEEALDGSCLAHSQVFVEGIDGYVEGLDYDYDPEEARRILDEQGVGELTLETLQSNFEPPRTLGTIVQAMLEEIDVHLNLTSVEPAVARSVFAEGNNDAMSHVNPVRIPDASAMLVASVGGPLDIGQVNAALIPDATAAAALPLGSPERDEAYRALNEQLFEAPAHVIICVTPTTHVAVADLVGADNVPFRQLSGNIDLLGLGIAKE